MRSHALGVAVLILATAMWAELALIPLATTSAVAGGGSIIAVLAAAVPIVLAIVGVGLARSRERLGVGLVLAGFPIALGAFAAVAAQHPLARFDAPARVIAAATAVGFVFATVAWAQSLLPPFAATVTAIEPPASRAPPPPLRRSAPAVLALVAAIVAVVFPAVVASREVLTRAERLGGEPLARGREGITAAGGLAIALWLVLDPGADLLRARPHRRRRATRAMAYLIWGVAAFGLKLLLDRLP